MSDVSKILTAAVTLMLMVALLSIMASMSRNLMDSAQEKLANEYEFIKQKDIAAQIKEQEKIFEEIKEDTVETIVKQPEQQTTTVIVNGNVDTGNDYIVNNESQKIDYSFTIIIVAAIIIVPIFVLGMTVLILMHKKAEREHTEKVLTANIPTYHEQEIADLKCKYKGGEK